MESRKRALMCCANIKKCFIFHFFDVRGLTCIKLQWKDRYCMSPLDGAPTQGYFKLFCF